ncbi:hypothetical protein [Anaerosolibacter sp.]|uniref:hypothetical protein n=1 Tax=Anaerosolibacter sp. TaxID=1872527 RepID=UPI0039EE4444
MWNWSTLLPGTGSDKSNLKRETELLGKVWKHQMYKLDSEEWLLSRINPDCENCNNNDYYNFDMSFIKPYGLPLGKLHKIFRIVCPNCGETIELDVEEFIHIDPLIKVNNLFESGKIDESEYKYRLQKIERRYHKI